MALHGATLVVLRIFGLALAVRTENALATLDRLS